MNLNAKAHYFSCKRALAEAEQALATKSQGAAPQALADMRLAVDFAERACLEAEMDWRFSVCAHLLVNDEAYQRAFTAALLARKVVEQLGTIAAGPFGLAKQVVDDVAAAEAASLAECEAIVDRHIHRATIAEGTAA